MQCLIRQEVIATIEFHCFASRIDFHPFDLTTAAMGTLYCRINDIHHRGCYVDADAITNSQIPEVIDQWREPDHQEFQPRNAWSLFNAFTEATKKVNPHTQIKRGEALQRLFDTKYEVALVS